VRYQKSLDVWNQLKLTKYNHESYFYTQDSTENSGETTIAVENGKVTQRSFKSWLYSYGQPGKSWHESANEIGSHTGAYDALTFDQVYEKCKNQIISQESANTTITFSVDADGILKECTATPVYRPASPGVGDCTLPLPPNPAFRIYIRSISALVYI
jgi:hypothetical protein